MPDPQPDSTVARRYWSRNVRIVAVLLSVWALVSFGGGIVFAPWLNRFTLPFTGYPLGFWIAQQGSIVTFVLLVFAYVALMNRVERDAGMDG
ncbi:MAG: DUF4212 domain-containing protein [Myxococcota bacterium]